MNKLTRKEIQKLSEDKLNWRLYQIRHRKKQNHLARILDPRVFPSPCNYCKSLDAQFDLAEKMGLLLQVRLVDKLPKPFKYIFTINPYNWHLSKEATGGSKRTGAELLLEAIQEKENHE